MNNLNFSTFICWYKLEWKLAMLFADLSRSDDTYGNAHSYTEVYVCKVYMGDDSNNLSWILSSLVKKTISLVDIFTWGYDSAMHYCHYSSFQKFGPLLIGSSRVSLRTKNLAVVFDSWKCPIYGRIWIRPWSYGQQKWVITSQKIACAYKILMEKECYQHLIMKFIHLFHWVKLQWHW